MNTVELAKRLIEISVNLGLTNQSTWLILKLYDEGAQYMHDLKELDVMDQNNIFQHLGGRIPSTAKLFKRVDLDPRKIKTAKRPVSRGIALTKRGEKVGEKIVNFINQ